MWYNIEILFISKDTCPIIILITKKRNTRLRSIELIGSYGTHESKIDDMRGNDMVLEKASSPNAKKGSMTKVTMITMIKVLPIRMMKIVVAM